MHIFSIIFCIVVSACQNSVFYSNYSCPCQFTKPREKSIAYSLDCLVPKVLILDYYFLLPPNIMAYDNLMISLCKFDRGLRKTIQTIAFLTIVLRNQNLMILLVVALMGRRTRSLLKLKN